MILDPIVSERLPRRQSKLWGELRPGDSMTCPHDLVAEIVVSSEAGDRGRHHVAVAAVGSGNDVDHTHVRPSSDIAPGAFR